MGFPKVERVCDSIASVFEYVGAVFMILITIQMGIEAILRTLFSISYMWLSSFSTYYLIWMTFLAMPVLYRRGQHIAVDFFPIYLKKHPNRFVGVYPVIVSFVVLGFSWVTAFFSFMVLRRVLIADIAFPTLFLGYYVPQAITYIPCFVGFVFLGVFSLETLANVWGKLESCST